MARRSKRSHVEWFQGQRAQYESLASLIAATLEARLRQTNIEYLSVNHRAKTVTSFEEKIQRKRYVDPKTEVTDLAGVRVVTLIERDIERVAETVKSSFRVRPNESIDKSSSLASDQFGYRSLHLVCDIGPDRERLPEFSPFVGMPFEIQIRTTLQHVWAEIEHDRSYKFSGELPTHLKRRFNLIAGLLELADREFSSLTESVETYSNDVAEKAKRGDLGSEINSPSVAQYLALKLGARASSLGSIEESSHPHPEEVFDELRDFGVSTLSDLDQLFTKEFIRASGENIKDTTQAGFLRDAMIYADIEKYFSAAWKRHWQGWDEESIAMMESKYGRERVAHYIQKYDLDVMYDHDEE